MDTHNLSRRSGLKTIGIVITQILLGSEREPDNIVNGIDILGRYVHCLHLVPIERYIMIDILYQFVEPFSLQFPHLLSAHAFLVRIPDHNIIGLSDDPAEKLSYALQVQDTVLLSFLKYMLALPSDGFLS